MRTIGIFTVADKIADLIENNVTVHPTKPNTFIMGDYNNKQNRMVKKFKELNAYFTKFGAEMEMLGFGDTGESYMNLEFTITDTVASSIESFLNR